MKKLILFAGIVISTFALSSCNKQEPIMTQQNATSQEAYWKTPDGYLIPYSEKGNWKQYLKDNLEENKIGTKYYGSKSCVFENSRCSLECVEVTKPSDCTKTSACAPCINCC
jgi:hypothetical protein